MTIRLMPATETASTTAEETMIARYRPKIHGASGRRSFSMGESVEAVAWLLPKD